MVFTYLSFGVFKLALRFYGLDVCPFCESSVGFFIVTMSLSPDIVDAEVIY